MPITYNQTGVTYDAAAYTFDGDGYQPTVFPIAGVYIAFTDGPYVASPAWTEVTQYVRGITTHRGRASDLDQFDTGTAQLVLDNRDRRFDPFYTSGPYYPNGLTPRRQIRIVGQIGGSTYEVFRGFIAGWPVTWSEAGYDSTVTIQCFDALGLMATEVVPTDWAQFYTLALSPRRYYRCNDSRNAGKITDQNNTTTPMNLDVFGTPGFIFETPPMADGLSGNSLYTQVDNNLTGIPTNTSEPNLTVCAFVNIITGSTGSTTYGPFTSYTFGRTFVEFRYNSGGTNGFWITLMNAGTTGRRYTLAAPPIGTPFHLAVVVTSNSGGIPSAVIYQNGIQVSPTSTTPVVSGGGSQESMRIDQFQLSEFAVFTSQLTAAQVAQIYNSCTVRFSETTTARMQRLLDTTDWPAALEGFPASPVGTVAEIGSGTGVIPELQLVADSEGGELYVSKTGVLTMTARRDVFNATRSANVQATFTDSGVGIRYGTELQIQYDADNLKNDITVNYSGDGEVNVYNDTVITGYGAASTTIETQLDSPTSALDLATLELGVEGVLVPQISPIDVSSNTAAADWQTILGLELLDRVNFKRTPTVGNQFNRDALVNAIDHQIEPGVWRTQLTLSMRYTSPLTLDDPVLGRLDYNYLG